LEPTEPATSAPPQIALSKTQAGKLDEPPKLPDLSGLPSELKEFVLQVLAENAELRRLTAALRDEVARLKGYNGRPHIKPSGMDPGTTPKPRGKHGKRRRGKVMPKVRIEEQTVTAAVPAGSRFKGYEDYVVQDLVLQPRVIRYRRERWITPDGQTIVAPLPDGVAGHFGPELRRYILMQYHQGQVTVPRLVAQLQAIGVSISKRQVMRLLIDGQEAFSLRHVRFCVPVCNRRVGSRWMILGRDIEPAMATALRSATRTSPGSVPPTAKAG